MKNEMIARKRIKIIDLDPTAIGKRLRRLRQQRGLLLRHVEERTGVDDSSLGLVENGHRLPSLRTLVALSVFYRRSLGFLALGLPRGVRDWTYHDNPPGDTGSDYETPLRGRSDVGGDERGSPPTSKALGGHDEHDQG